jgi:hypothetical protein
MGIWYKKGSNIKIFYILYPLYPIPYTLYLYLIDLKELIKSHYFSNKPGDIMMLIVEDVELTPNP